MHIIFIYSTYVPSPSCYMPKIHIKYALPSLLLFPSDSLFLTHAHLHTGYAVQDKITVDSISGVTAIFGAITQSTPSFEAVSHVLSLLLRKTRSPTLSLSRSRSRSRSLSLSLSLSHL